ncbi:hypothetical protein PHMEG_0006389 [Phytophthora megakarya]|uniref:Myb/SANT-like domain-containing protein n=1 Tax=Phytophthora megakarya TaxID=4795 RepID=A0A225WPA9_9STRA|nr:hypothetical protein PHMEG_0006389 [Phytophthora megakarya]
MGKDPKWSSDETVQLCKAWLNTSQTPIRGAGMKKDTFYKRVYQNWLATKNSKADPRSEIAVSGRWKKLQPEVTMFEGVYGKVISRERSGWNEDMHVKTATDIYSEKHKQPFEFMSAWMELRDKAKWTSLLTATIGIKRKALEHPPIARPGG